MNGYVAIVAWRCEVTGGRRQAVHVVGAESMEQALEIAKRNEVRRWGSGEREVPSWSISPLPENDSLCVARQ
jgi:hypothetical protein